MMAPLVIRVLDAYFCFCFFFFFPAKMARLKRAKEKSEKEVALRFQVEADFERKVAGVYEFKFSGKENCF